MRGIIQYLLITLLIWPTFVCAQTLSGAANGLQATNLPAGAKGTALGGAFSAWDDDATAVYWNPAGMAFIPKAQVQAAYNQWFQDTFFQDLGAVVPFQWGALGARLSYINLGSIAGRDAFGFTNGTTLSPDDWGGSVAIAGRMGDLALGLTAKIYDENLSTYNDSGLGIDLGALYRSGDLGLSLGARNIGLASNYSFPAEYYLGSSWAFGPAGTRFHLGTDATLTPGGVGFHHGLEFGYQKIVFLRAGYQWFPSPVVDQQQTGLSGGVGVALGDFQLDYSIVSYGDLGTTNRVSIGFQFSNAGPASPKTAPTNPTLNKHKVVKVVPVFVDEPPSPPVRGLRSTFQMGLVAYQTKNYEKAAELLQKVTTMNADNGQMSYVAEADNVLGIIYQYHLVGPDSLDKARYYYHAALKLDPNDGTAKKHLIELLKAIPKN